MLRVQYHNVFNRVFSSYNVFNRKEDKSMVRAVAQYYIHQGECSYRQGSGPILFVHIM